MNKTIVIGLTLVILVAILAQFFAATDPDGLESTLAKIKNPGVEEKTLFNSPMQDYKIPFLGESPFSGAFAAVIGIFIIFGVVYSIGIVLRKRKT